MLGIVRGAERQRLAARIDRDDQLSEQVATLELQLATLESAAQPAALPEGLFNEIVGRVDAGQSALPGTLTLRAVEGEWIELSPGVSSKLLHNDPRRGRRSMLVRMLPGSTYAPHAHADDEECLVLEGDLSFGALKLLGGDYHLAPKGVPHPIGFSQKGCLLYISAAI